VEGKDVVGVGDWREVAGREGKSMGNRGGYGDGEWSEGEGRGGIQDMRGGKRGRWTIEWTGT
jgi:hypothetical protein